MPVRFILILLTMLLLISSPISTFAGDGSSKANQYAKIAEDAYWAGDLDTSITNYAQAHTLASDNEDYLLAYVRNLVYGSYEGRAYAHRAETALTVAEAFANEYPDSVKGQSAYVLALTSNDKSQLAIAIGIRAIELAPEFAETYAYLSLAYQLDNRWQQAQENAQMAVNLDAKSIDAHRALALSLAVTGEWALAIEEYRVAISLHPMLDALYFELAPYYIAQEDYESAQTVYNTVIEYHPENAKAWTRKCETFFRQRDDNQAIEACQEALRLEPESPDVLKMIGMVSYTMRDYEAAIGYFEDCITTMNNQAIPVADQYEECYYLQGLALQIRDNCDQAISLFAFALDNLNLTERGKIATLQGIDNCVENKNFDSVDTSS